MLISVSKLQTRWSRKEDQMMKKLFVTALLWMLPISATAQLSDVPDTPKADAKYLFYLHGVGIEQVGVFKAQEDYSGIVNAFQRRGFIVISEVRSSNTRPNEYGKKVAGQVKALIAKGVSPENITVVGYSKGGMIALMAAAAGDNEKVNYVILAGCFKKGKEFYRTYANDVAPKMKGRILSMYDAADPDFGTCQDFFVAAGSKVTGKEIKFETRQGHGLFWKGIDQWMSPLSDWASGK
jgi:triacylglycerol esterase/lipase EstA (alpha/beta hydrolase family)